MRKRLTTRDRLLRRLDAWKAELRTNRLGLSGVAHRNIAAIESMLADERSVCPLYKR